ncbi:MAG: hypothetical protein NT113_13270 [Hyphomicrobiales bacterium]|nr:hypothetical protein [Hyphomicrobiales bacterium]
MADDIVNAFFKRFYPKALDHSHFEYSSMLGGMMSYKDPVSVQGHYGAYSHPRDDFADRYSTVEVGFPSEREELLMPYIDGGPDTDPTNTVYGYVPVSVIEAIVAKHGGLVEATA